MSNSGLAAMSACLQSRHLLSQVVAIAFDSSVPHLGHSAPNAGPGLGDWLTLSLPRGKRLAERAGGGGPLAIFGLVQGLTITRKGQDWRPK